MLDRYILAKTDEFVATMTAELDALNVAAACDATRGFLEVLSNWYIRRSRDRFWDGDSAGSQAAFDTLYTVLETTCRAVAPLLPLTAEEIWRGLTGGRSVHLTDWPAARPEPDATEPGSAWTSVRRRMDRRARGVLDRVGAAQGRGTAGPAAARRADGAVADAATRCEPFAELITDELNVRELVLTDLAGPDQRPSASGRCCRSTPGPPAPGWAVTCRSRSRRPRPATGRSDADGAVTAGGIALLEGEYELKTVVADADPDDRRAVAMLPGGGFVILDTAVTPELAAEGLARDVVRAVQQARRDAGLAGQRPDRADAGGDAEVAAAIETHAELIKSETLATSLTIGDGQARTSTTKATVGAGQRARSRWLGPDRDLAVSSAHRC